MTTRLVLDSSKLFVLKFGQATICSLALFACVAPRGTLEKRSAFVRKDYSSIDGKFILQSFGQDGIIGIRFQTRTTGYLHTVVSGYPVGRFEYFTSSNRLRTVTVQFKDTIYGINEEENSAKFWRNKPENVLMISPLRGFVIREGSPYCELINLVSSVFFIVADSTVIEPDSALRVYYRPCR
jgi:hypothetical protein